MSKFEHLIGLEYISGRQDCYSICRQYLRENYGIRLPNFARPERFWEDPSLDLYAKYRAYGFRPVLDEDPTIGDVLLMPIFTAINSHAAVVVDDNRILHHLPNRLSTLEPLRPKWLARTNIILRHPAVETRGPQSVTFQEVSNAPILRDPAVQERIAQIMASRSGAMRGPDRGEGG